MKPKQDIGIGIGFDCESGWYYAGARYYDPDVGVWMKVDPKFGETGEYYGYGALNPILFVNPNGEETYVFFIMKNLLNLKGNV